MSYFVGNPRFPYQASVCMSHPCAVASKLMSIVNSAINTIFNSLKKTMVATWAEQKPEIDLLEPTARNRRQADELLQEAKGLLPLFDFFLDKTYPCLLPIHKPYKSQSLDTKTPIILIVDLEPQPPEPEPLDSKTLLTVVRPIAALALAEAFGKRGPKSSTAPYQRTPTPRDSQKFPLKHSRAL